MLADSPTNYEAEPDSMEFLRAVPSVWDETRVLDGKLGDYVVVARRRGQDWYIGAMTDWTPRDLEIDLAFLGDGARTHLRWDLVGFADDPAAAQSFRRTSTPVDGQTHVKIKLAPGGGFAARVTPRWIVPKAPTP
jgi:alpha-glucosidase